VVSTNPNDEVSIRRALLTGRVPEESDAKYSVSDKTNALCFAIASIAFVVSTLFSLLTGLTPLVVSGMFFGLFFLLVPERLTSAVTAAALRSTIKELSNKIDSLNTQEAADIQHVDNDVNRVYSRLDALDYDVRKHIGISVLDQKLVIDHIVLRLKAAHTVLNTFVSPSERTLRYGTEGADKLRRAIIEFSCQGFDTEWREVISNNNSETSAMAGVIQRLPANTRCGYKCYMLAQPDVPVINFTVIKGEYVGEEWEEVVFGGPFQPGEPRSMFVAHDPKLVGAFEAYFNSLVKACVPCQHS
jgi:hypothetical protein